MEKKKTKGHNRSPKMGYRDAERPSHLVLKSEKHEELFVATMKAEFALNIG